MTQGRTAPHLYGIDVVRVVTVVGVIAVHSTSLLLPSGDPAAAVVLRLLHSTREVFVLLSAFVLTYSAGGRRPALRPFWRRRFPLVLLPYAVWTLIYVLADGHLTGVGTVLGRLGLDLLSADARYQMYFLLLTFQLYLVYPWVVEWLRRQRRAHLPILIASSAFQLLFTAAAHYRVALPVPLSTWVAHPGTLLVSYQLYVVAGVLGALHFEALVHWLRGHPRAVAGGALAAAAFSVGTYFLDVRVVGMTVLRASEVFQPAVVVESMAFSLAAMACGLWIADRAGSRLMAAFRRGGDVSFGVFLAHPLLLQVAVASGLGAAVAALPVALGLAVVLGGCVPLAAVITGVAVDLVRRTRLSPALTGRHRRRPAGGRSPLPNGPAPSTATAALSPSACLERTTDVVATR
jgi:peptidoglycan/LPS O-acetylase OafA/YrhL